MLEGGRDGGPEWGREEGREGRKRGGDGERGEKRERMLLEEG